ncbi:hypothetical protein AVEN_157895-1 [Araneus ventricosus]|uniref:Uncharacterized protein n=1 Tax=Araneus ventricosus TaxID=182803 RepID=A0A4Y2SCL5_ARAVE|nr:hypothetical protein AVEN_157895-1 [Araneus ventricosus]
MQNGPPKGHFSSRDSFGYTRDQKTPVRRSEIRFPELGFTNNHDGEHKPYSPDLAPCDFFSFPHDQGKAKGTRFETLYAVKANEVEIMKRLSGSDLKNCFGPWKIRGVRIEEKSTLEVIISKL